MHKGRTTSVLGQFLDMPSTQSPMLGTKQETCAGHQVFHIENISVLHPPDERAWLSAGHDAGLCTA